MLQHSDFEKLRVYLHCVSKKTRHPFVTIFFCQILTDFRNYFTAKKYFKFATKQL